MPELPEVEVYKNYLTKTVLHKKITHIDVLINKILQTSKQKLELLKDAQFTNASRYGKYCFLQTNKDKYLILHFGMSGKIKYYKDSENDPQYSALIFKFADKHKFAFINPRQLGKIYLEESKEKFIEKKELGPDVLSLSKKEFITILQNKKGMIKPSLMDQKALCGIGNIYSDEILYHANIKPNKKIDQISKKDFETIYAKTIEILKIAIKKNANPLDMPDSYLIHNRRKDGANCGICDGKIKKIKIGGRSCYFCKSHQK